MNENSSSNLPTAAATTTKTRWFSQKLPTQTSRKRKKQNGVDSKANRVVASPNVTKTQIAKISYVNPLLNMPPETDKSKPSSILHAAQINFVQKRKERDLVIKEFKSMLNQLNTRSSSQETILKEATNEKPCDTSDNTINPPNSIEYVAKVSSRGTLTAPSTYRRSKTDMEIIPVDRPKSLTERTKSSNQIDIIRGSTARTPSSANASRKCSYDPNAARRFMKAQQKRRRSSCLKPGQEDAMKKEEIKKRLEDLKKQSRLIVSKNIKKQKGPLPSKKIQSSARSISPPDSRAPIPESAPLNPSVKDYAGQVPGSAECSDILDSAQRNSNLDLAVGSKSSKSVRTIESEHANEPVSSQKSGRSTEIAKDKKVNACNRRVGILRKPETKDHSFSHIADFSFEKEDVAIEMLTPQIPPPNFDRKTSQATASQISQASSKPLTAPIVNETPKSIRPHIVHEQLENKSTQVHSSSSLIGPPNHEATKKEAVIQTENVQDPEGTGELPFWLRPSAVQVYPYNFIQAVRRKLLALAEPVAAVDIIEGPAAKNEATSTRGLTPDQDKAADDDIQQAKEIVEVFVPPKEQLAVKALPIYNSNVKDSQTVSDLNSNLSSISLQAPISNTVSEVSSLKSESVPLRNQTISVSKSSSYMDKDDTTISSSVFSSPEKQKKPTKTSTSDELVEQPLNRAVSPLSLERIEKLKIKPKAAAKSSGSETVSSKQNLDFNQLLSDFNHGLSQVIEANEQLKSTLDKSQLILSPKGSIKSQGNGSSRMEAYTTDFEEPTCATESSEQREKQNKRKILKTTTPLLSSPPDENGDFSSELNRELKLDLGSVSPSSVHSSELSTTAGEESSVPDFKAIKKSTASSQYSPSAHEERLATIDQLKQNLRRMIKESQENRKAIDKENSAASSRTQSIKDNFYKSTSEEPASTSKASSKGRHKKSANKSATEPPLQQGAVSSETANTTNTGSAPPSISRATYSLGHTSESLSTDQKPHSSHCSKSSYKAKNKSIADTNSTNHTISDKSQRDKLDSCRNNKSAAAPNTNYGHYNAQIELSDFRCMSSSQSSPPPPGYSSSRKVESPASVKTVATTASIRTACSSEIVTLLKVADLDLSRMSSCEVSLSDSSSFNYSNVGLYEKLIKSEITKSEHLAALLKMREKALLDRTKGQVAWLQVQKERCKSKGLLVHIAEIRKKQRAILLKMSKEREEIKRLLQSTLSTSSDPTSSRRLRGGESALLQKDQLPTDSHHHHHPPTLLPLTPRASSVDSRRCRPRDRRRDSFDRHSSAAPTVFRATHELESSASVEALLRQREEDLRRRREYCERLLEWHRKLDDEELEVYNLERQLFNQKGLNGDEAVFATKSGCSSSKAAEQQQKDTTTSVVTTTAASDNLPVQLVSAKRSNEMERRLKEIDKSLRELNSISATTNFDSSSVSNNAQDAADTNLDFVRTTGSKLNKLWRRLTSQQLEKYEPNRRYKLCKADLERLYEEAKLAVLTDFSNVEDRSLLLEKSSCASTDVNDTSIGSARDLINAINAESTIIGATKSASSCEQPQPPVPSLNLNFSTSQSAEEQENSENLKAASETFSVEKHSNGDYSPSIAEQKFHDEVPESNNTSSATTTTTPTTETVSTSTTTPTPSSAATAAKARSELIKRNLKKFLRASNKAAANKNKHTLERSLSDTEIDAKSPTQKDFANKTSSATWTPEKRPFVDTPHQLEVVTTTQHQSGATLRSVASLESFSSPVTTTSTSGSIVECINIPTASSDSSDWKSCKHTGEISPAKNTPSPPLIQARSTVIQSTGNPTILHLKSTSPTSSNTHKSMTISSLIEPQQITNEFDTKSNEIAAKLNEISEAVARLSQSSSLPSVAANSNKASKTISTNYNQDQKELEIQTANSNSFNNTSDFSYSTSFESDISRQQNSSPILSSKENIVASAEEHESTKTQQSPLDKSDIENRLLDLYELDLHENTADETLLDEVSMPLCLDATFDTTGTTLNLEDIVDDAEPKSLPPAFESQENVATNAITTPTKPQTANNSISIVLTTIDGPTTPQQQQQQSLQQQLMPDIINELEIRRCQQILLENEQIRQYEQVAAVPYVFVREIPNKPPPPYCPPAHGSPMTTIFPSEERIKDITFRRTHELYCQILKTEHVNEKGEKLPSVLDEKITNIYERIVLDICREYLDEHSEVLNPRSDPSNFHSQLAFFNPPDRLRCIQESIYKDVRRCLGMDKTSPKRTAVYSIYGQRAKRDHIGQIIIQEMYEEDEKWCSFYHEEDEVLDLIIEEMIGHEISKTVKSVLVEEGVELETTITTDTINATVADETEIVSNCSQVNSQTGITTTAENSCNDLMNSSSGQAVDDDS